jgi:serine/threonine protein kinase
MNATAPFLAFASSRRCKNVDALQLIRRHASRQSSIGDGPEIELLPTIHRIRLAFPNITSSTSLLRQYLDCVCDLCKPQHNALGDPEREEALPLEIISSDDKLKAFAALVLAGCLFALREYHRDADNGLENFCRRVKSNQGLRGRLFPFAIGGPSTCPHDDPDPTTTPLPHQCIPCVATSFRACVRSKLRLLHVKSLRKWTKIEDIYSDSNLPIIQEQLEHADKRRPTLRFSRCRIEPTHCSPEELSRHELFRKRYTLAPQDDHKFEEDEAKIALSLASLEHPSIAKVLLAFREETNDDISYLSLLFKREDYSLEDYLQGHASQAFEDFTGRDGNHTVLLDHGLWKGLLGIVDAVATIHEVSDGTVIPKCAGPRITGHYDIKPANILISGHGSLLLTDFGQAARRKPGTNDYAPPELARSDIEPEKSYDAWSLACLLLQALVFIEGVADGGSQRGKAALEEFNSQRINETSSNRSAAFWIEHQRNGVMVKTLRGAVEGALKRLERWRHHQTQIVVEQLRSMLDINPVKRPSVRSCHKQFKAGVGRNIFRLSGDRQIEPMLATW